MNLVKALRFRFLRFLLRGRGHLNINYTSIQWFIISFFGWKTWYFLIYHDWLVNLNPSLLSKKANILSSIIGNVHQSFIVHCLIPEERDPWISNCFLISERWVQEMWSLFLIFSVMKLISGRIMDLLLRGSYTRLSCTQIMWDL